jgi:hypothetical protein
MLKKHVVLFEANNYGWIAYSTTFADAKRLLSINATHNTHIFYIFECNLLKQNPYTMKLKFPFSQHYDFRKIIIYKEEDFEENEKYMTISYADEGGGICLDVTKSVC